MFVQVNTLQAIKDYFEKGLETLYSKNEIATLFEITCEHFLGWNKIEQRTKLESRLSESELLDFHFTLKRLKKKEPIQYILGEAPFYGLLFEVNADVLIPRPETEELVHLILKDNQKSSTLLDIGTGSGCIPISIAQARPKWEIYATDISEGAIQVAKVNATKNDAIVTFGKHDILSNSPLPTEFPNQFDIIVSNPPYVRYLESSSMEKNVLEFEPHLALFVENEDPLLFYRAIAKRAKELLEKGGKLYFEINQYLAKETRALIEEMEYANVKVYNDINNNPRILYAEK